MGNVYALPLPNKHSVAAKERLLPGARYQLHMSTAELARYASRLDQDDHLQLDGLIADYQLSSEAGLIIPLDTSAYCEHGFLLDTQLVQPKLHTYLKNSHPLSVSPYQNRLTILESGLIGPEVISHSEHTQLSIKPYFRLQWHTEAFASQLACVRLVEATRSLHLDTGEILTLLDTETAKSGAVLYLPPDDHTAVLTPVTQFQAQSLQQKLSFSTTISQVIPEQIQAKGVVSLTVLEKYTDYFMQNAAPAQPEQAIWTPVHLPISWGWSIRVQKRFDGVWDIFRKKLILPSVSTEIATLPSWRSNSLHCSQPVD
jgi:hypothetical protein